MRTRRALWIGLGCLGGLLLLASIWAQLSFPSDRTPKGAYLRVVIAVNRGRAQDFFAYTETRAQHACYTIRDYRKKCATACWRATQSPNARGWPPNTQSRRPRRTALTCSRSTPSRTVWMNRLRKDMSGIAQIDEQGERATVQTVHGTRYPFRRRDNGIWGLTLFTATLSAEAEKAARDLALIEKSASDYEHAAKAETK